ncbi:ABC transporter permease [Cohnella sp. GbtcB17]|uniref:ABC transporter permease n=1 Tax=Cohnella sp. GbtcB17 TaxID=2824762 RepID=UPI001C2FA12A|nr:ABC transporter permease [Cohnella sp. GbtcB17]
MLRMIRSEWLKTRRLAKWLLLGAAPGSAILTVLFGLSLDIGATADFPWKEALALGAVLYGSLLLPLLTGVYAAIVCRYEHFGGGWKQLLALPVSRTQVYMVKLAYVAGLIAFTQVLFLALLLLLGAMKGGTGSIPWATMLSAACGGWIASLPLAALQLAVSSAWTSFAAPLAVNVAFTLPNMLVANSETYAPYYPWLQPMLAMTPGNAYQFGAFGLSPLSLYAVVFGSFVLFLGAGWGAFFRRSF